MSQVEAGEDGESILVDGKRVGFSQETDPAAVPWGDADIVLECSGCFLTKDKLQPFLKAGAKKVVVSAACKVKFTVWALWMACNI